MATGGCEGLVPSCSTKLHSSTRIDPYRRAGLLRRKFRSDKGIGGGIINPSLVGASVAVVSWLMDGGMKRKRCFGGKDKVILFQLVKSSIYFTIQQ